MVSKPSRRATATIIVRFGSSSTCQALRHESETSQIYQMLWKPLEGGSLGQALKGRLPKEVSYCAGGLGHFRIYTVIQS
jgi:hypothetical protein